MSQDSSFRQAYDAREKVLMDEATKFAHAETEGIKRGMEQGMKQGIKKALKKVLNRALKKALNRALNKVEKKEFSRGKFK